MLEKLLQEIREDYDERMKDPQGIGSVVIDDIVYEKVFGLQINLEEKRQLNYDVRKTLRIA